MIEAAAMVSKGRILVTGGAGFIGTHTAVQLLKQGFKVSIVDNLDNAVEEAVHRVRELVGAKLAEDLDFHLVCVLLLVIIIENYFSEFWIMYRSIV